MNAHQCFRLLLYGLGTIMLANVLSTHAEKVKAGKALTEHKPGYTAPADVGRKK